MSRPLLPGLPLNPMPPLPLRSLASRNDDPPCCPWASARVPARTADSEWFAPAADLGPEPARAKPPVQYSAARIEPTGSNAAGLGHPDNLPASLPWVAAYA